MPTVNGTHINARCVSVRFEDSAGTGLTVDETDGELSLGAENAHNAEIVPVYERGQHAGSVITQDLEQELSLAVKCRSRSLMSSVAARIKDFVLRRNYYSGLQSVEVGNVWIYKVIVTRATIDGNAVTTYPYVRCTIAENQSLEMNTFELAMTNSRAPVDS